MADSKTPDSPRPISLALQGGGSHGALTWGVLERLSESDAIQIKAITATSAGAMNAVAFVAGMEEGGPAGARASLEGFWREVSRRGAPFRPTTRADLPGPLKAFSPWTPYNLMSMLTSVASPYELNPFDFNPLRDILSASVDFDLLPGAKIALHLAATNVETGRAKIFTGQEATLDATLASACLPHTFKAVEIDGVPYWDGGYMGNPSLFPLIYSDAPRDILLVMLNPFFRKGVPKTSGAIRDRLNEINFNSSLIGELRAIGFVQKLLDDDMLKDSKRDKYRHMLLHIIRGGPAICEYALETKYDTRWSFLTELRDTGRALADDWLTNCAQKVGVESSVDVRAEFLEET